LSESDWDGTGFNKWNERNIRSPVTEAMWKALVIERKRRILLQVMTERVNGYSDLELDTKYVRWISERVSLTP
jgi:hypothetical protein